MNGEKSRTKRKGKILKALGMLRDVVTDPNEIKAVEEVARLLLKDFDAPVGAPIKPVIEIIDDTHQKFNGLIYTKDDTGHYQNVLAIHRAVYNYFFGDIPSDCVIHHLDTNKDNNDIMNLALMTRKEHNRLHLDPHPLALEAFMEAQRERLENINFSIDAPKVEIIDADHQKFNGMIFSKVKARRHYHHKLALQRAVWTYFNGEISDDEVYIVHHIDGNTDNNNIENLALITRSEHGKIHAPQFVEANKKRAKPKVEIRLCPICHQYYLSNKKSKAKTCSRDCGMVYQWQNRKAEENLHKKVCLNCGKDFTTPFKDTRFCSHGCARQFRNKLDDDGAAR